MEIKIQGSIKLVTQRPIQIISDQRLKDDFSVLSLCCSDVENARIDRSLKAFQQFVVCHFRTQCLAGFFSQMVAWVSTRQL
jgi:hypothetical protein